MIPRKFGKWAAKQSSFRRTRIAPAVQLRPDIKDTPFLNKDIFEACVIAYSSSLVDLNAMYKAEKETKGSKARSTRLKFIKLYADPLLEEQKVDDLDDSSKETEETKKEDESKEEN